MSGNWKWKEVWCSGWLALMVVACMPAHAAGRLFVELRHADGQVQKTFGLQSGVVELVLRNTGDQAIEIDRDSIPVTNRRGELFNASLSVVSLDGEQTRYMGAFSERIDDGLRTLAIPPGEETVRRISIPKNYGVIPGRAYRVSMPAGVRYLDRPRSLFKGASLETIQLLLKVAEVIPAFFSVDPGIDLKEIQKRRSGEAAEPSCDND